MWPFSFSYYLHLRSERSLTFPSISRSANPLHSGDAFTFQAHGYFTENLTANATVNVTGWYETNPLAPFSSTKDFCKMADQVDMDDYGLRCPPPQGNGTITAVEVVPWGLPEVRELPVHYSAVRAVYSFLYFREITLLGSMP